MGEVCRPKPYKIYFTFRPRERRKLPPFMAIPRYEQQRRRDDKPAKRIRISSNNPTENNSLAKRNTRSQETNFPNEGRKKGRICLIKKHQGKSSVRKPINAKKPLPAAPQQTHETCWNPNYHNQDLPLLYETRYLSRNLSPPRRQGYTGGKDPGSARSIQKTPDVWYRV